MNVLFAYPLVEGSNAYELFKALNRNEFVNLYTLFTLSKQNNAYVNFGNTIIDRILNKLKLPKDNLSLNEKLLKYDFTNIDILFTIKGNTIYPWTLKKIKDKYSKLKIVSWSLDDMYAWHNRSLYYTLGLKYYDLLITSKSYNVEELKQLGAKNVLFQYQAYSKDIHKPYPCNESFADVLFIGYFEWERYENMLFLASNGIKVDIYGYGWNKYKDKHKNLIIHDKSLVGENYSKALSCSKISLCFLRKINRDLHTTRSLEIPACNGFMIAERTEEHKNLFEENSEAIFFTTKEELYEKVFFYLKNNRERNMIAKSGYKKCIKNYYSYDDRVTEIINKCKEIDNEN